MTTMINQFGKKDEEMFAGIFEPKIDPSLILMDDARETQKTYRLKLVECLLHWLEELRNFAEMTADFESIPLEAREKAAELEPTLKHMRPDKQANAVKGLPVEGRKALNYMRSLPDKKLDVLKAKRAAEHTQNVLRDVEELIAGKYGTLR